MVEGRGGVPWHKARRWLYERPEDSKKLLRAISVIIVDYLVAKLDSGASMVMVFDTNAGDMPPHLYEAERRIYRHGRCLYRYTGVLVYNPNFGRSVLGCI